MKLETYNARQNDLFSVVVVVCCCCFSLLFFLLLLLLFLKKYFLHLEIQHVDL